MPTSAAGRCLTWHASSFSVSQACLTVSCVQSWMLKCARAAWCLRLLSSSFSALFCHGPLCRQDSTASRLKKLCELGNCSAASQRINVQKRNRKFVTSSDKRGREGLPGPTNAAGQGRCAISTHGRLMKLPPRPEITEWYVNRWMYSL